MTRGGSSTSARIKSTHAASTPSICKYWEASDSLGLGDPHYSRCHALRRDQYHRAEPELPAY